MENISEKYKHIKGWGIDTDPLNEPTYPMKKYTGDDHERLNYEKPPEQTETVEVLHSNERPTLSAVYGTSVPPAGLSGMIRRWAFRYSESSFAHWIPLLLADRINVVEGNIKDLSHGKVPNVISERGLKSEWEFNKLELIGKAALRVAAVTLIVLWIAGRRKKQKAL